MPLPHFLRHFFCYDPFPDMLPRRERRKPSLMYFIPIADFNPRSREGSDQWLPILFVHSKISIHAPARGATEVFRITPSMKLFQSTLPRGERHLHRCNRDCRDDFNPRSREGSDNSVKPFVIRIDSISIHAPARGATVKELCEIVWGEFQSTLPRGERPMGGFKFLGNNGFQSTLPRVERQRLFLYLDIPGNFNPRSREWSDPLKVAPLQVMPISIHAPASGATDIIGRDVRTVQFQSTLPRVERRCGMGRGRCKGAISIHAPASGATQVKPSVSKRRMRFQSTLPRVERHSKGHHHIQSTDFNPRSREWSDGRRNSSNNTKRRFQSTLPRVERLFPTFFDTSVRIISIHAPASGATSRVVPHKL